MGLLTPRGGMQAVYDDVQQRVSDNLAGETPVSDRSVAPQLLAVLTCSCRLCRHHKPVPAQVPVLQIYITARTCVHIQSSLKTAVALNIVELWAG